MTQRYPTLVFRALPTLLLFGLVLVSAGFLVGCDKGKPETAQPATPTKDETGVTIDPKDEDYQPPLPPPSEEVKEKEVPAEALKTSPPG